MTHEEAKLILQAVRLDREDLVEAQDPEVLAAMEQVQQDPELAEWWKAERALDLVIRSKLGKSSIPSGLQARILQAHKQPHALRPRLQTVVLRLAASIALITSLFLIWLARPGRGSEGSLTVMQADLSAFVKEFPQLDLETKSWPEIKEWLAQGASPSDFEIPAALQKYPGIGCRGLQWREKRVFLVCFAANGEVVHLFIVPPAGAVELTSESRPHFSRVKGWSTASWTRARVSYLVLTKGNETFLKGIIRSSQSRG